MTAAVWQARLRAFLRRITRQAAIELAQAPAVPMRQVMVQTFGPEPGQAHGTGRLVFDPRSVFFRWVIDRANLPLEVDGIWRLVQAHPDLSAALLTDAAGNPAPEDFGKQAVSGAVTGFVSDFLNISQERPSPWDTARFDRLFNRLSRSLESGSVSVVTWGPVEHLEWTGVGAARLTPGVKLLEPDEATLIRLSPTFYVDAGHPFSMPPRFYLRSQRTLRFKRELHRPDLDGIEEVVLGIRLSVGGDAKVFQRRIEVPAGEVKTFGVSHGATYGRPRAFPFGQPSVIGARDIPRAVRLAGSVAELRAKFPIALERFQLLPDRERPADKLIDSVVGLESLLLPGLSDELKFRFSLRGARLLGRTSAERKEWFDRLTRVYQVRSDVVHGDPKKLAKFDPALATEAERALRLALVAANARKKTAQLIAQELDSELLR